MLLHRILGLREAENIFLAEESMEDQIALPVTSELLSSGLKPDRSIEIIGGLGVAVHLLQPAEFWLLLTDRYSKNKILEGFVQQLHQTERFKTVRASESDYFEALIEYYALALAGELLCDSCAVEEPPLYVEERIKRLQSFLKPIIPEGARILEICCGSGMATQSLLRLGHAPWSVDSDKCDLCQALRNESLPPKRSFVLDARLLNHFFQPRSFDAVVGFMVGLINEFNWPAWRETVRISSDLARKMLLYTVYTEKEVKLIASAMREAGWSGKVIDNRDPRGIYDQWAFLAIRD